MIGTSDQSCWLAEACKIPLLLLGCWLAEACKIPSLEGLWIHGVTVWRP